MNSKTVFEDSRHNDTEIYTIQIENSICDTHNLLDVPQIYPYIQTSFKSFQAQHPQLVKVLMDMKTPSPCRVASDKHQPKSGCLKNLIKIVPNIQNNDPATENSWNNSRNSHDKAPVVLNFKRSSILARRTQI
ncbi:unnamed protein product [Blepharisma stoltei]|uniref:Uncharacterized protein n=1 Tax=Blepharisma stoltei TaxID=1481888 RepID=A0AAU9K5R6_9CILI|nr:unnamed protein product [Blepharisma stoltei]